MSEVLPVYPFDPQRCIGTISEVGPSSAKANLPSAASPEGQWLHGHRLGAGEVGEFVIVECRDVGIFGRIINVRLPERERLNVEPELGSSRDAHPLGTVQLLTTILLKSGGVVGGISQYPRLGSKVYAAHPLLVKWMAEATQRTAQCPTPLVLDLAYLPSANDTLVNITPERIFGRHCAILGATGGGKSWTLGRLLEQVVRHNAKIILFDATGEFHTSDCGVRHVHIGDGPAQPASSSEVVFPYSELTESDLFALFKPSGQTQAPKLRAAMKSLKLAKLEGAPVAKDGIVIKAEKKKAPYDQAYVKHSQAIESSRADFDIAKLTQQIIEECVFLSGFTQSAQDFTVWGKINESEKSYCVTLITRIEDMLQAPELACVFQPAGKASLSSTLDEFLSDTSKQVLRVSLKYLPFAHNAREIVANAVGRHLLAIARTGRFRSQPVLVFLDEAHQFLDKTLGDENTKYPLDAFELIAKEGRKFCLNICIATQRPRDIPEGVLSQMGTLIVHRLINDRDREVVERASGDIDRSAAAFLPTLAPGQAVIIGVDFPIPLTIQVSVPNKKPDSRGPDYQTCWQQPATTEAAFADQSRPGDEGLTKE
jgi:energy-coupling factor transporter ATP-binding protein EcfA2